MQLRLVGYGAICGDGRGYRWLWQAPELSEALLNRCLVQLDCRRFADPQKLRLLQPHVIEGGLLTVEGDWCAAYRFFHGGRDGSREKFSLIIGFFLRSGLSQLDLSKLFRHPLFKAAQETCPTETIIEFPESSPTASRLGSDRTSSLDSLAQAVATCVSAAADRGFHLRVTGDLQNPVAKFEQRDFPGGQQAHPKPTGDGNIPVKTSTSVNPGSTKTAGAKALIVAGVFIGLLIGFCIGWWIARNPTERNSQAENSAQPVRLLSPLAFDRFTKTGPITRSQATSLLNEKVKLDSKDPDDYAFLVLPAPAQTNRNPAAPPALPVVGQRVRVETVAEYLAALKRGAGPFTTFDQAVDGVFQTTATTLKFLAEAVESHRSSFPVRLLEELPVSILGFNDSDQQRELATAAAKGTRLSDFSRSGKLQRFVSTATTLKFESSDRTYLLTELARGDFNGDGFEDSLVGVNWHYREGTGTGCSIILVQRFQNKSLTVQPFLLR